jgi:phage terminase large subunit GpA-like protein
MGHSVSKDRLEPMFRTCPSLAEKVADPKSRHSSNTILHKSFPGGHLTIIGANSPTPLAARPIRYVLNDETDRDPQSAGREGNPSDLAEKRTQTFWNRKILETSTPTIKGHSRIEKSFAGSDQRFYFIPCPHCGEYQILKWSNVIWDKTPDGTHLPETATYACDVNGCVITDVEKLKALQRGEWRATAPFNGVAGFFINELYSPWSTLSGIVAKFLEAKRNGPESLRVFVNTTLGEAWEDEGNQVEDHDLAARREEYPAPVPMGGAVLTAGVDVQDDRLAVSIYAWGTREECWLIDHREIFGAVNDPDAGAWADLTEHLERRWRHESGTSLMVGGVGVDTGGHFTKAVEKYVQKWWGRRVFAMKGASAQDAPPVRKSKTKNRLFIVGVDGLKSLIYSRLRLDTFGPGYMHFHREAGDEYFKQLTAEKRVTKYVRGFPKQVWTLTRPRNEALDCVVYALAALLILNPDMERRVAALATDAAEPDDEQAEEETREEPKRPKRGRTTTKKGWAKGW